MFSLGRHPPGAFTPPLSRSSMWLARITYQAKATRTRIRLISPPTASRDDVAVKGVFDAFETTKELKRLPSAAKMGNRPVSSEYQPGMRQPAVRMKFPPTERQARPSERKTTVNAR